jgi:hypothetical protein
MSLVLVGSTSGSITLQEPAIAGSTVLTLPAVTGTVLTTTSPKAGNVIQVVTATTTTSTSITGTTYTDTTLTASITPSSSSSKILVLVYQPYRYTSAATGGGIILLRGSTALTTVNSDSTGPYVFYSPVGQDVYSTFTASFLDSPATTSSTTYKTQARPYNSGGSFVVQNNGPTANSMATITLMEIAG